MFLNGLACAHRHTQTQTQRFKWETLISMPRSSVFWFCCCCCCCRLLLVALLKQAKQLWGRLFVYNLCHSNAIDKRTHRHTHKQRERETNTKCNLIDDDRCLHIARASHARMACEDLNNFSCLSCRWKQATKKKRSKPTGRTSKKKIENKNTMPLRGPNDSNYIWSADGQ